MSNDDGDWWPETEPRPSRLLRYQMATIGSAALLRMETGQPRDVLLASPERYLHEIALLAPQCRQIAAHLLEMAALLERHEKPLQ